MADITIVDNITRAIPNMIKFARELKDKSKEELEKIVSEYDNKKILAEAIISIREYLTERVNEVLGLGESN